MAERKGKAKTKRKAKEREPMSAERARELAEELEREGRTWSPLVVHGDEVLGGLDHYEAAVFLGMEEQVAHLTLEDLFLEAGMDMPQIASPDGDPEDELFEDYLRELPRHIRDKYEI